MAAMEVTKIPVLPFPPGEVRKSIKQDDFRICFKTWTVICESMLQLPPEMLQSALGSPERSTLSTFLTSYITETAKARRDEAWRDLQEAHKLSRHLYRLTVSVFQDAQKSPDDFVHWTFLGYFCKVYQRTEGLRDFVEDVWKRHTTRLESSLQKYKAELITQLEAKEALNLGDQLPQCLLPLLRACPSAGTSLVTGSDLLDAIVASYAKMSSLRKEQLLLLMYLTLLAPLQIVKPNRSLLFDHLYSLKADNIATPLLADLVTDTPFLSQFRKLLSGAADEARGMGLASSLEGLRKPRASRTRKPPREKLNKGKAHAVDGFGHGESYAGVHVHRMSLVSQVQDIFPDLGSAFIVKLLDEYQDNVELVTAALLEDDLPPHLLSLNRSEQLAANDTAKEIDEVPDLVPKPTPPPSPPMQRRNIYDNDELDRLQVPSSRLHFGRKDTDAETFQQDTSSKAKSRAAIVSALAAFDADDDERDDTYDIADVGGTVDTRAGPEGDEDAKARDLQDHNEEALFRAYKLNASMFGRDSATRRSQQREALKSETGMTDEAIEGWAIMTQRDTGRMKRLEAKYATFGGEQQQIQRTSYRAGQETDSEAEGTSSGPEGPRGRGGAPGSRGRGRGGRGRGRGGDVAGPANDQGTEVSRLRKEANKGSRANHNRRDQRAKKMARGGMPG